MAAVDEQARMDPFLALVAAEDPYPQLHALRASDPVHWVAPLGFWFVTRHDDVKRLFHDPENVTGDRRVWAAHVPRAEGTWLRWAEDHSLFAMPAEDHARIRRLVSAAFKPRAVQRMGDQIREVVERFAAPLRKREGEVIDLLGDFANPIPNVVISRITGVPPGVDEDRFREIAQSVIAGFLPFSPPEVVAQAEAGFTELAGCVRRLCAERRARPQEDLVSDLIQAQESDDELGDEDIIILVTALIAAGSETTALGGMALILTLLRHPDAMERLRADRARIPKALDEIIRFTFGGPAGLPRYALRDFTLRGREIRKGQMLLLAFGGANRDPAVYADPDVLDVDRDPKDLTTFGNGPHFCLGAHLARQEMGCMLDALLDILPPGSKVREDQMQWRSAGLFRRPLSLPVEVARA
jgi:cytochrome P450